MIMKYKVKVVFHVHSCGSGDSSLTKDKLIEQAKKKIDLQVIFWQNVEDLEV